MAQPPAPSSSPAAPEPPSGSTASGSDPAADSSPAPAPSSPPRIVLCRPKYGGNVGAVGRAMANFGLEDLRIVRGPEKLDARRQLEMAMGAQELVMNAPVVDDLADAVAGCTVVIACTARPRRWQTWDLLGPAEAAALLVERGAQGEQTAYLFGQEDHGLAVEDLRWATHLCHIPTSGTHSSLNLSQAVLLLAWEWAQVGAKPARRPTRRGGRRHVAPVEHVDAAVDKAGDLLASIDFFRRRSREQTLALLRQALRHAEVSREDINFLRGVVGKLQWFVDHGPRKAERDAD